MFSENDNNYYAKNCEKKALKSKFLNLYKQENISWTHGFKVILVKSVNWLPCLAVYSGFGNIKILSLFIYWMKRERKKKNFR